MSSVPRSSRTRVCAGESDGPSEGKVYEVSTAVRLPGHGGRGTWWRPFSAIIAAARSHEFTLVNAVRQQAMVEFNRAGEQVDG